MRKFLVQANSTAVILHRIWLDSHPIEFNNEVGSSLYGFHSVDRSTSYDHLTSNYSNCQRSYTRTRIID